MSDEKQKPEGWMHAPMIVGWNNDGSLQTVDSWNVKPTLTDAERAALRDAIGFYINEWGATNDLVVNDSPICRTLRGLLERLGGDK